MCDELDLFLFAVCDNELRANAVHDYIYMGTLLASLRVDTSNDCLRRCMQNRSCLVSPFLYFHSF